MVCKTTVVIFLSVAIFLVYSANASPAIAMGYDPLEVCIENCAQCKKMLGAWFDGPLCAEFCIAQKGRLIPDCENYASIAPFLNKL